jgi:hypothetical protein
MSELKIRVIAFLVQIAAVLIDSMFLALWLLIHWWLEHHVVNLFRVEGVHVYAMSAFQVIFALATLFPIAAFVVFDMYSIYKKTKRAMAEVEANG